MLRRIMMFFCLLKYHVVKACNRLFRKTLESPLLETFKTSSSFEAALAMDLDQMASRAI